MTDENSPKSIFVAAAMAILIASGLILLASCGGCGDAPNPEPAKPSFTYASGAEIDKLQMAKRQLQLELAALKERVAGLETKKQPTQVLTLPADDKRFTAIERELAELRKQSRGSHGGAK